MMGRNLNVEVQDLGIGAGHVEIWIILEGAQVGCADGPVRDIDLTAQEGVEHCTGVTVAGYGELLFSWSEGRPSC